MLVFGDLFGTRGRIAVFTLLELLVVIGIVGLLAALSMPALSRARASARKSACLGNLHQIGVALNTYVAGYDGHLPVCARIGVSADDPMCVANIVTIDTGKVYQCPADLNAKYDGMTFAARHGSSYEWNAWLNGRLLDRSNLSLGGVMLHTPLLGDADSFHGALENNYLYADGSAAKSLEKLIE